MTSVKTKKEWLYWITGVALFILLLIYVVYAIAFMAEHLNNALNPSLIKSPEAVKFNFDKMKELNIPGLK